MTPSKTYLKFQETRSKEDLDTLNGYLLRLQQISVILNGDTELSNEEENKLYDEDETLTDKVLRYITRITSMRKNMPKSLITTLTSSKNQKLFTLSPKKPLTFLKP